MSPLRFCMVTTFYPPYNFGGDGVTVQRFARALVRRGHGVTVVHDEDAFLALAPGHAPVPTRQDDGVEVIGLRSRLGVLSPLLTQQSGRPVVHAAALRRVLDGDRFDVIHFHNVSLVGGPGALSFGTAVKLYTAHEHWLVCPTHVLWRHDREACPGRQCVRCTLRSRRPPQLWRATGYLDRQCAHIDAFIALSEFSRAKHHEMGFAREMEVLPPFLPALDDPEPAVDARPQQRPYFLFVGRLERIKGLDDVIPVFRDYPHADLLVAGEGGHGASLRAAAEGIPGVRFLGRLEGPELQRYLHHAIAVIVPSVGYETFGLVLIEAFRSRTPVIARRIGPFPEIVEACEGGALFSDPTEMLVAMRRLQHDPQYRTQCASAGHRGYVERWTEDIVVPRYLELVDRVRSRKPPSVASNPAVEHDA